MLWHMLSPHLSGAIAHYQSLNFTGMGGPMGVIDGYDTDVCASGGTKCTARDNEGNYGGWVGDITNSPGGGPHGPSGVRGPLGAGGLGGGGKGGGKKGPFPPQGYGGGGGGRKGGRPLCPKAFDCNGIPNQFWHEHDGAMDEYW